MNGPTPCGGPLTAARTWDPYCELVVPNCADAVPTTTTKITSNPSRNARSLLSSEMAYRIPTSFETFWQSVGVASPAETADQSTRQTRRQCGSRTLFTELSRRLSAKTSFCRLPGRLFLEKIEACGSFAMLCAWLVRAMCLVQNAETGGEAFLHVPEYVLDLAEAGGNIVVGSSRINPPA